MKDVVIIVCFYFHKLKTTLEKAGNEIYEKHSENTINTTFLRLQPIFKPPFVHLFSLSPYISFTVNRKYLLFYRYFA